jgi:hypothetical protein
VKLRYKVADDSVCEGFRRMYYASSELLDFQSSIVLAKSESIEGPVQKTIDRFLQQLSWMRRMASALHALNKAGHFNFYPNYHFSISVLSEITTLKAEVLEKESLLIAWQKDVLLIREQFYFVNYFEVKRLLTLIFALENSRISISEQLESMIADYICFLNVDAANDLTVIRNVIERIQFKWNLLLGDTDPISFDGTSKTHDSAFLLRLLAECLEYSLSNVQLRTRRVEKLDFGFGRIKPGKFIYISECHQCFGHLVIN